MQRTPEEVCATIGRHPTLGFPFACLTSQANLQDPNAGFGGYCMYAESGNIGLVGYSAITFNGGAFPVTDQSAASARSGLLGNQSPGYVRCTRLS